MTIKQNGVYMLEDIFEIIIPTFNRSPYLKNTLESLLDEKSPVKNVNITILDNASFDGTGLIAREFAEKHSNVKHIINERNTGGDVNICKAYGMAKKEYAWVLCDDDSYSWEAWPEVVKMMSEKIPVIYAGPVYGNKKPGYDFYINEMSFVPYIIFRSEIITDDLLTSMYKSTYTLMQQMRIPVKCANENLAIGHLSRPIIYPGQKNMPENHRARNIMRRGIKNRSDITAVMEKQPFLLPGKILVLQDVQDPQIREKAMRIAMKDYPGDMILEFIRYFASKTELLNIAAAMFMCLSPEQQRRLHKIRKMIFGLYMVEAEDKKILFVNFLGRYRRRIWTFRNKSSK